MIETAADRRLLVSIDGEEVVIDDGQGGSPIEVDDGAGGTRGPIGILSYEHTLIGAEIDIASREPALLVPTDEVPGVEPGWRVATSEGAFEVSEPARHDGLGMTVLLLARPDPDPIS